MDHRRALTVAVALAALSSAFAASLVRVFAGGAWVAPVLAAAIVPHALSVLTRKRSTALALGASFGGLVAIVVAGRVPATTWYGIPRLETLQVLHDRLGAGLTALREEAAPVPPRPGTVLLAVLAVWALATAADVLAVRRRATIGALAPGVTLCIWIAALSPETPDEPWPAVAIVVSGAAFLGLQRQVLLAARHPAADARRPVPAPGLVLGGVALATLAAIVAVALTPALPGAGAEPLVDFGGNGGRGAATYQTSVPPLVDVADRLRQGAPVELFTVRAPVPQYWRTVALDEYSEAANGQWTLRASGDDIGRGLRGRPPAGALVQDFHITALGERWMPAALTPVSVSRPGTLVVEDSLTLVVDAPSVTNLRYRVVSVPPPTEVSERERRATAAPPPPSLAAFTSLPARVPASLRQLARQVTADATNAYDRAALLRDFFRSPAFTYDPGVDLTDALDATATFLRERRGFCVQFASTYALMARAVGIPARVAVGFTPGTFDAATGRYRVTNHDAHAWPEVWLAGIGWTNRFDPTPPSDLPGGSALPGDPAAVPAAPAAPTAPAEPAPPTPGTIPQGPPGSPTRGADRSPRRAPSPFTWALPLAFVVLAAVSAVPAWKALRRHRRRRRADPAARVAGAWAEALDRLRELGHPVPIVSTPGEIASRAAPRVGGPAGRHLVALAATHTRAHFGPGPVDPGLADDAWQEADAFAADLAASLPAWPRIRARWAVGSLRRARSRDQRGLLDDPGARSAPTKR